MSHQLAMSCPLSTMHSSASVSLKCIFSFHSEFKNSLMNGFVNWKVHLSTDSFTFFSSCWFPCRKFIIEMQFTWYHVIHSNLLDFSWMNVIQIFFFISSLFLVLGLEPSTTYYPKRYVEGPMIWSDLLIFCLHSMKWPKYCSLSFTFWPLCKCSLAAVLSFSSSSSTLNGTRMVCTWKHAKSCFYLVCTNWTVQSIHSF